MMASRNGNADAIKVLLDHKADVNAKETLRGTTALMWAAEQSHPAASPFARQRSRRQSLPPLTFGPACYLAPSAAQPLQTAISSGATTIVQDVAAAEVVRLTVPLRLPRRPMARRTHPSVAPTSRR